MSEPDITDIVYRLKRNAESEDCFNDPYSDVLLDAAEEITRLRSEVEALRQNAERWLLIRLSNKTRVQVVRDGAWHTLFYGGHENAEDVIDALRGEGE